MNIILDDINITSLKQLLTPIELMEKVSLNDKAKNTVKNTRESTRRIIHGEDDRLFVIVGHCSIVT